MVVVGRIATVLGMRDAVGLRVVRGLAKRSLEGLVVHACSRAMPSLSTLWCSRERSPVPSVAVLYFYLGFDSYRCAWRHWLSGSRAWRLKLFGRAYRWDRQLCFGGLMRGKCHTLRHPTGACGNFPCWLPCERDYWLTRPRCACEIVSRFRWRLPCSVSATVPCWKLLRLSWMAEMFLKRWSVPASSEVAAPDPAVSATATGLTGGTTTAGIAAAFDRLGSILAASESLQRR